MHTYTRTSLSLYIYNYICIHTYICRYAYVCVCVHVYIYIYISMLPCFSSGGLRFQPRQRLVHPEWLRPDQAARHGKGRVLRPGHRHRSRLQRGV